MRARRSGTASVAVLMTGSTHLIRKRAVHRRSNTNGLLHQERVHMQDKKTASCVQLLLPGAHQERLGPDSAATASRKARRMATRDSASTRALSSRIFAGSRSEEH